MKEPSKTLLISEVFPPQFGGSGHWFYETYRRQQPNQYAIVVNQHPGSSRIDQEYPQSIHRVPMNIAFRGISSWQSLREYYKQITYCRKLMRREQIRTIHAARPLWEGLAAAILGLRTGAPFFCYVHGEDVNIALTSRELKWVTGWVLKRATKIIANSNFSRSLLLRDWRVSTEKIAVMHPGVDTTRLLPPIRRDDDRPLTLLTVGRLQTRKGHDTVIHAISKLVSDYPNLRYEIIGDGGERTRLEKLVQDLQLSKHVEFLGEADDTQLLKSYQSADIFVLANRAVGNDVEGFGIVLLEAQACGLPVIAGDSGGTPETMLPNESGFVVNCQEPELLVVTLRKLLDDARLREAMGARGREHVRSRFDWDALATEAEMVFGGRR